MIAIIDKFKGGPVGLTTISTAVGEEAGTIEEVYEPFLIQEGYIQEECTSCGFHERRVLDYKIPLIMHFKVGWLLLFTFLWEQKVLAKKV